MPYRCIQKSPDVLTKGDKHTIIVSIKIVWDKEKNEFLKKTRFVSFEMVLEKIYSGDFIGPQINPTRSNQQRIIVFFGAFCKRWQWQLVS